LFCFYTFVIFKNAGRIYTKGIFILEYYLLMNHSDVKILGVGSPLVDVLVNVDDDFLEKHVSGDKGGMELVDISVIEEILEHVTSRPNEASGGSAANTILAMASLGVPAGFLGKLGKDRRGSFFIDSYRNVGCSIDRFKFSDTHNTGTCLSLITPDSQRTMRTYLGAASLITEDDVQLKDFKGYTHLHIEGYMIHNKSVITKVLKLAKEQNLTTSIDLASFEIVRDNLDFIKDLIDKYVDIVFANEEESVAFTGSIEPECLLDVLGNKCSVVAVKLGKKGSIIKSNGLIAKIEAKLVNAVDTTGAGDLWQAGFLYGYIPVKKLSGKLLEKAGGFAALLGAEVVQVTGATIPEHRWPALRSILEKEINE